MEMFRLPFSTGNGIRRYGDTVVAVPVTKGKKYYTDASGRKYDFTAPAVDLNGNTYYPEHTPDFTPDFMLFETEQAAKDHQQRRLLAVEISKTNIFALPLSKLLAIRAVLEKEAEYEDT